MTSPSAKSFSKSSKIYKLNQGSVHSFRKRSARPLMLSNSEARLLVKRIFESPQKKKPANSDCVEISNTAGIQFHWDPKV